VGTRLRRATLSTLGPDLAGLSFRTWLLPKWGAPLLAVFEKRVFSAEAQGLARPLFAALTQLLPHPSRFPKGGHPRQSQRPRARVPAPHEHSASHPFAQNAKGTHPATV